MSFIKQGFLSMKHIIALFFTLMAPIALAQTQCAPIYQGNYKKLNSNETLNLCEMASGKTVLIVNTASYCGFTKQFSNLQTTYTTYKDQDFIVIGFPSDDFYQEDSDQKKTAQVCYINYGVTFPITQPVHVRGSKAAPIFKEAIEQSRQTPGWNFHKYLIDANGQVVGSWSASSKSTDKDITSAIEKALKKKAPKSKA